MSLTHRQSVEGQKDMVVRRSVVSSANHLQQLPYVAETPRLVRSDTRRRNTVDRYQASVVHVQHEPLELFPGITFGRLDNDHPDARMFERNTGNLQRRSIFKPSRHSDLRAFTEYQLGHRRNLRHGVDPLENKPALDRLSVWVVSYIAMTLATVVSAVFSTGVRLVSHLTGKDQLFPSWHYRGSLLKVLVPHAAALWDSIKFSWNVVTLSSIRDVIGKTLSFVETKKRK